MKFKISINLIAAKYTLMFVSFAIVMVWVFT